MRNERVQSKVFRVQVGAERVIRKHPPTTAAGTRSIGITLHTLRTATVLMTTQGHDKIGIQNFAYKIMFNHK